MKIRVCEAVKRFEDNIVLNGINVEFNSGYGYGIQGENGCGKTVLLKTIAGYMKLTSGHIYQDETEIRLKNNYLDNAGILIENVSFLPYLTLLDNLRLLKTMSSKISDEDIKFWLDYYELNKYSKTKYKNLSLGTKQKLALIQAFIHKPKVLLLDEPMNALDEESVKATKKIILDHIKNDGLLLISSHISQDISDLCDEIYLFREGKIRRKD